MAKKHDVIDSFIKQAEEVAPLSPEAQAKYDEARGRRGNELKLWHAWNEGGRQTAHLSPLLKSMKPLIRNEADKRLSGFGGSMPRAAVESELTSAAVKSLQSYDPNRGVALTTHVVGGFRRISDVMNANRNAKYMPGADVKKYQTLTNATAELRDQLGRIPTPEELKPHLPGLSVRAIGRMQRGFSEELYTDMGDGVSTGGEERASMHPRDAFHLVQSELKEKEQHFGSLYFVPEGERQPAIKNIAKALSITPTQAYRLKANVETRMRQILRKE
jgi:DNA-directed RNA polymerase specialized sigma subunit